jgi:hypothetical protein
MCVFFVALTSYMVLMNLQDIGQTGIKVAQCECRATAVQVCGLNPAGRNTFLPKKHENSPKISPK